MTSRRKTAIAISAILIFLLSVLFFFYIRADILFYLEDTLRRRPAPDLTAVEVEGGDEYTLSELAEIVVVRGCHSPVLSCCHPLYCE